MNLHTVVGVPHVVMSFARNARPAHARFVERFALLGDGGPCRSVPRLSGRSRAAGL